MDSIDQRVLKAIQIASHSAVWMCPYFDSIVFIPYCGPEKRKVANKDSKNSTNIHSNRESTRPIIAISFHNHWYTMLRVCMCLFTWMGSPRDYLKCLLVYHQFTTMLLQKQNKNTLNGWGKIKTNKNFFGQSSCIVLTGGREVWYTSGN